MADLLLITALNICYADPHSTVGSDAHLKTEGRWFDPRLGQNSFRGLIIVIATRFIPVSPLSVVSTMVTWESNQWLGILCGVLVKRTPENMGRCTGGRDRTEILLKRHETPYNRSIKNLCIDLFNDPSRKEFVPVVPTYTAFFKCCT